MRIACWINLLSGWMLMSFAALATEPIPKKTVVLTFDDAVKSHRSFVAPLLKELGFGATFFVTHRWMDDPEHFMTWEEIGELHRMGFEIGNHTWSHLDVSMPKAAARLEGELALVDYRLAQVGVPKPISFAYPGNGFGIEAFEKLHALGYQFARRGLSPEAPYGKMILGAPYDPSRHHPLLIPTTGDAYPDWTFAFFQSVIESAKDGRAAVLMFHGVPDPIHPWVHTDPALFEQCMRYLKQHDYRVIALQDLKPYLPDPLPNDTLRYSRFPDWNEETLRYPQEVTASREQFDFWVENMRVYHRYSWEEIEETLGGDTVLPYMREEIDQRKAVFDPDRITIKPYPGGRHHRIGFLDGAIHPLRGTKLSVFLPWDTKSYAVIDVPEAIKIDKELLFLAHTHVPTIWDQQHEVIENRDWTVLDDGVLENEWELPNDVTFGIRIVPRKDEVDMELWLNNPTHEPFIGLRIQNCVLLKGSPPFAEQTNGNKVFQLPTAYVKDTQGRVIATAWEHADKVWGKAACPCMHSDPILPDCPPGETVRIRGKIWFLQNETQLQQRIQETAWLHPSRINK